MREPVCLTWITVPLQHRESVLNMTTWHWPFRHAHTSACLTVQPIVHVDSWQSWIKCWPISAWKWWTFTIQDKWCQGSRASSSTLALLLHSCLLWRRLKQIMVWQWHVHCGCIDGLYCYMPCVIAIKEPRSNMLGILKIVLIRQKTKSTSWCRYYYFCAYALLARLMFIGDTYYTNIAICKVAYCSYVTDFYESLCNLIMFLLFSLKHDIRQNCEL